MQNLAITPFRAACVAACAVSLSACTPPPPVAFQGFDGVSVKAVTVVLGAPLVDENWDAEKGPVTWRREVLERHAIPRRIFRKGQFFDDGFTIHEFALSCDLTAQLREGRITIASLRGPARACDAIRADAARVAALIDVLQEEGTKGAAE